MIRFFDVCSLMISFGLAGIFFLARAYDYHLTKKTRSQCTEKTVGKVIDIIPSPNSKDTYCNLVYEFEINGQNIKKTSAYKFHESDSIGKQNVVIYYNPLNPDEYCCSLELDSVNRYLRNCLIVGLACAFLSLLLFLLFIRPALLTMN